MLFADIVYQGKRVQEWPEEARPTFNGSSANKPSFILARTKDATALTFIRLKNTRILKLQKLHNGVSILTFIS